MRPANVPEQLRANGHCPFCGDLLSLGWTADPWAVCLVCKHGHRFFILPDAPLAVDSARASDARFPETEGLATQAVASFWLSDPRARSILNGQLAQLIRVILESRSVLAEPRLSFCAACGDSLKDWEQSDIYVQGFHCANGHRWTLRGGLLASKVEGEVLILQAEYPDATVSKLIASWLKGNPLLDTNLNESLRRILRSSPLSPPAK
jgi:hypothetical protein